ncbi:MAG: L-threonylcarbamoyladenylate synthase [bacterium]
MTSGVRPPDDAAILEAAKILRAGGLVVFPTETVYGLGANALDPNAVRRIFMAKGRPADNPVIVHVHDVAAAQHLVRAWPALAQRLADAFWPGPLSLILPRADVVPASISGGLDSVAIRIPRHPAAQALLREANLPVAAPSANKSGRPSPTRVQDAMADLGDKVQLYLDGGPTDVGVESTVVSLLGPKPVILRPGGITREAIEAVVGPVDVPAPRGPTTDVVVSPGMKYRHYAPKAHLIVVDADRLHREWDKLRGHATKAHVIASKESRLAGVDVTTLASRNDGAAWARGLFSLLRDLDAKGVQVILVEAIPEKGLGVAVMNRLRKAAE